ncbi:MAG: hypothetical protein V8K32_02850 [Candidatus Electrothrix gigas]
MGGVFNSFNLGGYGYSHLNPIKFFDPDGNEGMPANLSENAKRGDVNYYSLCIADFKKRNPGKPVPRYYEVSDRVIRMFYYSKGSSKQWQNFVENVAVNLQVYMEKVRQKFPEIELHDQLHYEIGISSHYQAYMEAGFAELSFCDARKVVAITSGEVFEEIWDRNDWTAAKEGLSIWGAWMNGDTEYIEHTGELDGGGGGW